MSYINIINHVENQKGGDILCKFKRIFAHEVPLNKSHPNYKLYYYNVMVEWETGGATTNPLSSIATYYPITCAFNDDDKNLLKQEEWR